jgi:hypothetical protein
MPSLLPVDDIGGHKILNKTKDSRFLGKSHGVEEIVSCGAA